MKRAKLFRRLTASFFLAAFGACTGDPTHRQDYYVAVPVESADWRARMPANPQERAYWNNSTAPSFIKVWLKDRATAESRHMILESPAALQLVARQWKDIAGEDSRLTMERYVAFMIDHQDRPIEIDFSVLRDVMGYGHGYDEAVARYIEWCTYAAPFTLAELGFANEEDMIDAYFDFDPDTGAGHERLRADGKLEDATIYNERVHDPRFIALLIDLGYGVGRGDYIPLVYIHKPPEAS